MHHRILVTNFRGADLVRKVSLVYKQVFFHTTESKTDQENEEEKNSNITCVSQLQERTAGQTTEAKCEVRLMDKKH